MTKGMRPMVGPSKILTVSYGTFSCTLEGFEDPFNTMKAIAEYFRELAAEDRYFGAEPPVPDAAMLHRIAEREIQRRVEARVQDGGVLLRAADPAPAPGAAPVAARPAAPVPQAEAAPAPRVVAPSPSIEESVAAKLARIRAAVDRARIAAPPATDIEDAEELPPRRPEPSPAGPAAAAPAPAAPQPGAVAPQPGAAIPEAGVPHAERRADSGVASEPAGPASAAAAGSARDDAAADPADDFPPLGIAVAGEAIAAAAFAERPVAGPAPEAEADLPARASRAVEASPASAPEPDLSALIDRIASAAGPARQEDAPTPAPTAPAVAAVAAGTAADAPADDVAADGLAAILAAAAEPEVPPAQPPAASDDAAPDDAARDAAARDAAAPDAAEAGAAAAEAEAADAAPAAVPTVRARVVKVRRIVPAPAPEPVAPPRGILSPEAEAELARELAEVEREIGGTAAADRRVPAARADAPPDEAVSRLMRQASTEMEGAETRRRAATIAHLKAAVAATNADRAAGAARAEAADPIEPYRDDLAHAVRPRRPEPGAGPSRGRPEGGARIPPLVLVSAQRIDRPAAPAAEPPPVRPRRVTAGAVVLTRAVAVVEADEDDPEAGDGNIFAPPAKFVDAVERLGAGQLPDLMEAAAAYLVVAEGRDSFTRPQLVRLVQSAAAGRIGREDGLRAFGTLLREGRILRARRGQFALAEDSHLLAGMRRLLG